MARYAKLVELTLTEQAGPTGRFEIRPVKLALGISLPRWLPGRLGTWLNHFWVLVTARKRILSGRPDLVHVLDGSYGYIVNRLSGVPVIATVHDLIPWLQQQGRFGPDRTSFLSARLVKRAVRGLRHCTALIAVSECTRNDLRQSAGCKTTDSHLIPVALDGIYLDAAHGPVESRCEEEPGRPRLILHIGNNGYYKNREGVLHIFAQVRASANVRLMMVGEAPSSRLLRLVEQLRLQEQVEFMSNIDDLALLNLYRNASVFLFPSIYEGFGWPPLEAMACGCPVVCSSAASLPEVVGDAALMAPAKDHAGLARLCVSILHNREMADGLRRKGYARARTFTRKRMGKQIRQVYGGVLENVLHARGLSA
jgi:glycosyltransferase involved in cell wall biosynthesis